MRARLSNARDQDGYARWVRATDTPLLILAVLFLVVLALPYAAHLTAAERLVVTIANALIWATFAVDYLARLYLADDRRDYVRRNVLDLLIVVLPFLRPLRALRLLRLLRLGAVAGVLYTTKPRLRQRDGARGASFGVGISDIRSPGLSDAPRRRAVLRARSGCSLLGSPYGWVLLPALIGLLLGQCRRPRRQSARHPPSEDHRRHHAVKAIIIRTAAADPPAWPAAARSAAVRRPPPARRTRRSSAPRRPPSPSRWTAGPVHRCGWSRSRRTTRRRLLGIGAL